MKKEIYGFAFFVKKNEASLFHRPVMLISLPLVDWGQARWKAGRGRAFF
jgi:hypothetical protein